MAPCFLIGTSGGKNEQVVPQIRNIANGHKYKIGGSLAYLQRRNHIVCGRMMFKPQES